MQADQAQFQVSERDIIVARVILFLAAIECIGGMYFGITGYYGV